MGLGRDNEKKRRWVGGSSLFPIMIQDTAFSARSPVSVSGPTGLARAIKRRGGGASGARHKTMTDADWCSPLMVLPLLPASPNQCEHSVHVHTRTHSIPVSTSRLG
ncbi:hypothetical protein ElyMa_006696600 [Elysia marginata]|uniref:Uncharacterized protein n=1 Tax=Elysia marginata TaxID=1093978 RepID=A0AAV4IRG6_9GAST|nr:hypothetical protein ElyMa_006696600 [Elysia marginata]